MPVDHSNTIIKIEHLSFAYGDNQVLQDVSLDIHAGDYLGIIGPNGGGKTTLIRLLVGLEQPDKGTISLYGTPLPKFKDWSNFGYVAQKVTNVDTHFPVTVKDIVAMGRYGIGHLGRRLNKDDQKIITESLAHVDLTKYASRMINQLSGGELQRVFIARALAQQPKVIILDEPTVGVDIEIQKQFYTLLKKLNQELGITLVLISHDVDVMTKEVTEIACINRGLVYHGDPQKFVKEEHVHDLYGEGVQLIAHSHNI